MTLTQVVDIEELDATDKLIEALMSSDGPVPDLANLLSRPEWQDRAACRDYDTELFFSTEVRRDARRICAGCSVATECLEYALDNPSVKGTWAGTSERRRRVLRANRLASQS